MPNTSFEGALPGCPRPNAKSKNIVRRMDQLSIPVIAPAPVAVIAHQSIILRVGRSHGRKPSVAVPMTLSSSTLDRSSRASTWRHWPI